MFSGKKEILLEDGLTIGGKPLKYTFGVVGHAKAYDFMFALLRNRTITESDIQMMDNGLDASHRKGMSINGN